MTGRHYCLPLGLCCLLALACATGCSQLTESWLFHPRRPLQVTPEDLGLAHTPVAFSSTDGVSLRGWWIPGTPGKPTVLALGDTCGNKGDQLQRLHLLHRRLEVSLFVFDYRGFGDSSGDPDTVGLQADVAAARALLHDAGWDAVGLVLHGHGVGAALAIHSACTTSPTGLVVEATFPDLGALLRSRHPLWGSLLSPWLTQRLDSRAAAPNLGIPTQFFHSSTDTRVPIGLGWQVFDACSEPKWFRTLSETEGDKREQYWKTWEHFLQEEVEPRIALSTADG